MQYSHSSNGIHRTSSDADKFSLHPTGSRSLSPIIPDDEKFFSVGVRSEDLEFGGGDGRDLGGASFTGGNGGNGGERMKIGAYYEELLKLNPSDALLLRNYAKYLHEVEKDTARAEEYYGRAILANPGDGELLSLYGTLIWETQRDDERAKSYLDQAIHAAPGDCTVLGSYAHFMWEAEKEEEVNGGVTEETAMEMVAAF